MKKKLKIWAISLVLIGITFNIVQQAIIFFAKNRAKSLYKEVQSHERIYVYETYSGALNSAIYIDDLKDSNAIINFYNYRAKNIDTTVGVYDIKGMLTMHEPLYVLNDLGSGSRMIEVIDFDTVCWGYIKGYIYKATAHKKLPSDSLIIAKEKFYEQQKLKARKELHNPSPYGFYCKDRN